MVAVFQFDVFQTNVFQVDDEVLLGGKQRRKRRLVSSNVNIVHYVPYHKKLVVEFKKGATYAYDKVPRQKYNRLINNKSVGGYLHSKIIPKHTAKRI